MLHYKVESEINTSEGRIDMFLEFSKSKFYIFEFKYEQFITEQDKNNLLNMNNDDIVKIRSKKLILSDEEKIAKLMKRAITDAKRQMEKRGYADRFRREYKIVHQVAVGIVGRSKVGVEIF
jgi:hypothetical protein